MDAALRSRRLDVGELLTGLGAEPTGGAIPAAVAKQSDHSRDGARHQGGRWSYGQLLQLDAHAWWSNPELDGASRKMDASALVPRRSRPLSSAPVDNGHCPFI